MLGADVKPETTAGGSSSGSGMLLAYTVDEQGTIDFPLLGKIRVEGMTRGEVASYIKRDHWIWMIVGAALLGAISGLYDKYLMAPVESGGAGLDKMMVQSWYVVYQCLMMGAMLMILWWPKRKQTTPFHWDWSIVCVSVFLSAADFVYFYALTQPEAMISIVSMIRRGSVLVSFACAAIFFHEKNLKAKAVDLALVLLGMICLYIGS